MLDLDKLRRGFLALALSVQASTFDGEVVEAAFIVEAAEATILNSLPLTPLDDSVSCLRESSVVLLLALPL